MIISFFSPDQFNKNSIGLIIHKISEKFIFEDLVFIIRFLEKPGFFSKFASHEACKLDPSTI
ncbi:MAG: hypothetical protein DWQ05_02750 [Calditrichaeota bacterium]|nr:MAG: hypothetical protein DWQ05_02750 [Calditrichota bacterium]